MVLGLLFWTELIRKTQGLAELTPAEAVPWINDPEAVIGHRFQKAFTTYKVPNRERQAAIRFLASKVLPLR